MMVGDIHREVSLWPGLKCVNEQRPFQPFLGCDVMFVSK